MCFEQVVVCLVADPLRCDGRRLLNGPRGAALT